MYVSEGVVVSAQVGGDAEAKLRGTADAKMPLHETQDVVSGAHNVQDNVVAMEYCATVRHSVTILHWKQCLNGSGQAFWRVIPFVAALHVEVQCRDVKHARP